MFAFNESFEINIQTNVEHMRNWFLCEFFLILANTEKKTHETLLRNAIKFYFTFIDFRGITIDEDNKSTCFCIHDYTFYYVYIYSRACTCSLILIDLLTHRDLNDEEMPSKTLAAK